MRIASAAALSLLVGASFAAGAGPEFMVTEHPLAAILSELVGKRASIVDLLPAGASPHSYDPIPSDLRAAERAAALFFVSPLLDGWAARLPVRDKIEVLAMVPKDARLPDLEQHNEHGADEGDPHFWTDPLLVKAALPGLVEQLSRLDPAGAAEYEANGRRFAAQLDDLNADLQRLLAPVRGRPVVLLHPSFQYMLHRYGMRLAAVITPSPGKEPTPRRLEKLVQVIREEGVRAVFGEPQLPRRPADVLAEAAGIKVALLDPIGGVPGRQTYGELLEYNARVLAETLR